MKKNICILGSISLLLSSCSHKETTGVSFETHLKATTTPKLFIPGIVTKRNVRHYNSSFSDDGKYLVYTIPGKAVIQTFENNTFSMPEVLINDSLNNYGDPHISPDGNRVILSSNRPFSENDTIQQSSLWEISRLNKGWSEPKRIKIDMGFEGGFSFPSITKKGVLYFAYIPADGTRNMDIYSAQPTSGGYAKPVKLPDHINTKNFEGDPFIDRAERFLIFAGFERDETYGKSDLYISFKLENGWSKAINLGKEINSHSYDGSPYVTADDKYLIFTSGRHPEEANEEELFNVFYVSFDLERYKTLI